MNLTIGVYCLLALLGAVVARRLVSRIELWPAKHGSLSGHSRWSPRIVRLLSYFEYVSDRYFAGDGAPSEVAGPLGFKLIEATLSIGKETMRFISVCVL